jgi:hypothetical protein
VISSRSLEDGFEIHGRFLYINSRYNHRNADGAAVGDEGVFGVNSFEDILCDQYRRNINTQAFPFPDFGKPSLLSKPSLLMTLKGQPRASYRMKSVQVTAKTWAR